MEQPQAWTQVAPIGMKEPALADASATRATSADFESVVHEHARFVFKVAYSVLRNVEDAEDAVQETFLRAYRSPERAEVREMRAWLARIAWRVALDRVKKVPATTLDELEEKGIELAAGQMGADEQIIEHERHELLHKLIATLPEELRQPLVLSTVQEMSSADVAQVLGIPEASVRTRMFRARQLLKDKLAAWMEGRHGR